MNFEIIFTTAYSEYALQAFELAAIDYLLKPLNTEKLCEAVEKVVEVLKNKPEKLNIMVTGRGAPEKLIAIADTVTEMKPIKHAFDNGIQAQRGIEFWF